MCVGTELPFFQTAILDSFPADSISVIGISAVSKDITIQKMQDQNVYNIVKYSIVYNGFSIITSDYGYSYSQLPIHLIVGLEGEIIFEVVDDENGCYDVKEKLEEIFGD